MFLPARTPFSLRTVIHSHGWIQLAPFNPEDEGESFSYIDQLPGGEVTRISVTPTDGGVNWQAEPSLSPSAEAELGHRLSWMLGLEMDFSAFYEAVAHEPRLNNLAASSYGRVLRSPTFFEDTVKTILTTNTTWAGTKKMARTLVESFGAPLRQDSSYKAFPTPEALAQTDVDTLQSVCRMGYRAPYVLELAQRTVSGELELEAFPGSTLPTPELRKELMKIKGIGGYAAANLLMLLGRYDFIPIDTAAIEMVSRLFHDGAPVGPKDVEAAFERWGEWRGLAYWFWDR